ncbi:MAG TPA: hypothetical protein VGA03_08310, partial [Anaerolineales bacterium]
MVHGLVLGRFAVSRLRVTGRSHSMSGVLLGFSMGMLLCFLWLDLLVMRWWMGVLRTLVLHRMPLVMASVVFVFSFLI